MSLTSHLDRRAGPVWAWYAAELSATSPVARAANRRLKIAVPGRPPVMPGDGVDHALVGTAADFLLRVCLRGDALDDSIAGAAATSLDRVAGVDGRAGDLHREAVERIIALAPWASPLEPADWTEVCRACLVLGRLEQWFRAGPVVAKYAAQPFRQTSGGYDDLARVMIGAASLSDLTILGRVIVEDHADLRERAQLVLNPTFALSRALGGADADVIADGLLLDLKAAQGRIVGRRELWQLIGYALADTDNQYAIREVGVSALRWRTRVTWPLVDLLAELSGQSRPLDDWRASFAEAVAEVRREREARVVQVRARREARAKLQELGADDDGADAPAPPCSEPAAPSGPRLQH